jgi:hypothetical protein
MVELSTALDVASHVLELAQKSDTSLKSYEAAVAHLEKAKALAGSESDITGIYGAIRDESGLPFRNGNVLD